MLYEPRHAAVTVLPGRWACLAALLLHPLVVVRLVAAVEVLARRADHLDQALGILAGMR